ncbi:efflux RND transporter periplasmic adaptor subunit [Marinigracilibium pacificum]|uniref:Efflux RND transporter periplasmic adaptor subunit n=1 Tax=Marinigracilibium pacificum TaxID=2729599 RepID=A0A848IU82_9BACT|nr:efflux RND transporter periplasmic adaptor subunit [Marinigracilibium pacificum]NMM47286.1 efflux RND transporter periplasmic adaptor subunit [Marinigracilibium pacificum]
MKYLFYIAIIFLTSCTKKPPPQQMILEIPVIEVSSDSVNLEQEFVGQVYGKKDIPIRSRVSGFLDGIHFKEGFPVKKGQLLYTIDAQPFKESLIGAQSELAAARTMLVKAENDLERIQPLADMDAVSKKELDAAIASKDAAQSNLNAVKAKVNMEEINLGYTKITSPIDGIIGKTNAKEGEFIGNSPGSTNLNTVSKIDTIHVEFFLTESDYLKIIYELEKNNQKRSKAKVPLQLVLADGSIFPYKGEVNFINREVDASTGAILIQAAFPNPNRVIRPGQFAKIRATVTSQSNALLIPQRTVSELQGRFSVWKLNPDNTVTQQQIEILAPYRDYFVVKSGLKKGDKIVLDGIQKVSDGMTISPKIMTFESKVKSN